MQKLLSASQTRLADQFTIEHEPIASIDLMERASKAFVKRFMELVPDKKTKITIYCGTGNNGGDGLAIARLLDIENYISVEVIILQYSLKTTSDFEINFRRINSTKVPVQLIQQGMDLPQTNAEVLIDAILGTGLNKPLDGALAYSVEQINQLKKKIIAVDIPTGMFADTFIEPSTNAVINADLVISFQMPKLNFLLPESSQYIKRWETVNIGLDQHFIQNCEGNLALIEESDLRHILKPREDFSHKGSYGHALIIAGKDETMGAALLCAEGCLNTGAGLTTVLIPTNGLSAINSRLPEIMAVLREKENVDFSKYGAVALGPGLGTDEKAIAVLKQSLNEFRGPYVIDADGLNMLAADKTLFDLLPEQAILTPHMKEFDRLFGDHNNWHERLETMKKQSTERELIIILKNRYTIIASPTGNLYFNLTGTPAMASGGSGDVLTGILVSLLAQGYSATQSAIAGVYLHGKTGNILEASGFSVVTASNLAKEVNQTIYEITHQ